MGCSQESEPSIDEQCGLDVAYIQGFGGEGEVDHALRLSREEAIADNEEKDAAQEHVIVDPHQQILVLYDELRPKLIKYLHKMYLKRDVAEELIQEAFLRLTTELMQPNNIGNVHGWIVRVVHNLAVDLIIRKEKDAARLADISSVELETVIDPSAGPDEEFRKKEQAARMQAALLTLTPQQQQCFNLRILGVHYKDIGLTLGFSEQRASLVVKQVAVRLATLLEEPKHSDR
ncbi:MAG: sigma-70 family RNA polymerase sigma factor [Edaphobacter sp.]